MLDVGGQVCADVGHGPVIGVPFGQGNEQGGGAVSLFMADVVLALCTVNRDLRLSCPVERVFADGVVQVAGVGGVILLGFL